MSVHRLAVILAHLARSAPGRRFSSNAFERRLQADVMGSRPGQYRNFKSTVDPLSAISFALLANNPAFASTLAPRVGISKLMQVRGGVKDMQSVATAFPIGVPGKAWGAPEKEAWRESRSIKRSYHEEVVTKISALKEQYDVKQYGSLSIDPERYPLYVVMTREWSADKPSVLVTGGVHGYETSGVQGAIRFLQFMPKEFVDTFNIVVVPCVSPWGYETIQRWNPEAVDPNRGFNPHGEVVQGRSFNPEPATEETSALIALLQSVGVEQWLCHIDLHETTDTDESEFRPAKAARDGVACEPDTIPDGFYLVSDETNPQEAWHRSMIDAVRQVTHIAPPDERGLIIGERVVQEGVIAIPSPRSIGLCAGVTNAHYATTTEVYPDSPSADDDQCNRAQVAAIEAGLSHIIKHYLKVNH